MYELVQKQLWLLALLISLRTKLCYHRSTHEFATAKWSITKTKQYTPMSGRLIITTKKTYCPWRPENVERILRDERLERARGEHGVAALRRVAGDVAEAPDAPVSYTHLTLPTILLV